MTKSKAIFMALLALAFGAQAAPVSRESAAQAALGWAASGPVLGTRLGPRSVASTQAFPVVDDFSFYAVTLTGGGTVFLTSDDALAPVIGFTSSSSPDLSPESPLRKLLERDIRLRVQLAGLSRGAAAPVRQPANAAWSRLTSVSPATAASLKPREEDLVSDIRVSPLLETKWSQEGVDVDGVYKPCYNYYTPNYDAYLNIAESGTNIVYSDYFTWVTENHESEDEGYLNWPCGCTATAMSQVMRYWRYPDQPLPQLQNAFNCLIDPFGWGDGVTFPMSTVGAFDEEEGGDEGEGEDVGGGGDGDVGVDVGVDVGEETLTRVYDWANMKADPNTSSTEIEREAIGRLIYDVGISLHSQYGMNGTSAIVYDAPSVFKDTFAYASCLAFWDDSGWNMVNQDLTPTTGLHERGARAKIVYANLDAGRPVVLGIYGYTKAHLYDLSYWAGHAVVADGYGFVTVGGETYDFCHINMGWAGSDDMWYNVPEIDAANTGATVNDRGVDFLYMIGAAFNISPNRTGEIISGRVLDNGAPVAGARVSLYSLNGFGAVTNVTTDAQGRYLIEMEGIDEYCEFDASSPSGERIGMIQAVPVMRTEVALSGIVNDAAKIGNIWGADMELADPKVRVNGEGYLTFDRALIALGLTGQRDNTIEVLKEIPLNPPFNSEEWIVNHDCTITTAEGLAPADVPVDRVGTGTIKIAKDTTVVFSNVVFSANGSVALEILDGGTAVLVGEVGLERILIRKGGRLEIAGALDRRRCFVIESEEHPTDGVFAYASEGADLASVAASADLLVCASSEDKVGIADGGEIAWGVAPIPDAAALATLVQGEERTNFRSLGALLGKVTGDATAILHQDASFGQVFEVTHRLAFVSDFGARITPESAKREAGFTVSAGGELIVSNVTFSAFSTIDGSFITVAGGGALTLERGGWFEGLRASGNFSPVNVVAGTVTLKDGSRVTGCQTETYQGGFLYLKGADCRLVLEGGRVTGCWANGRGGAVYAGNNSAVEVCGKPIVSGNASAGVSTDNIYLTAKATLTVTGDATGATLGVAVGAAANNVPGSAFGTIDAGLPVTAAAAFFCDCAKDGADLIGAVNAVGTGLVWKNTSDLYNAPLPPEYQEGELAVARVTYDADGTTEVWASLQNALESVRAPATVELLQDDIIDRPVTVPATDVRLVSAPSEWFESVCALIYGGSAETCILYRLCPDNEPAEADPGFVIPDGASLTVEELIVVGAYEEDGAGNALVDLRAGYDYGSLTAGRFFSVTGGALTLGTNAVVTAVYGAEHRDDSAVVVWKGGTFTMTNGAEIAGCFNDYRDESDGTGHGAGVLVDEGTAYFCGGSVHDCSTFRAAGVFVGNKGKVHFIGENTISGNVDLDGAASDLMVADLENLFLDGELTGRIGYLEGVYGNTNVFGRVGEAYEGDPADLVPSAAAFVHTLTGAYGMIATNAAGGAVLVWSDAYGDDLSVPAGEDGPYWLVFGEEPYPIEVPAAVAGLVYDGEEQTGVAAGAAYEIVGNVATNAGIYEAEVMPKDGFAWSDDGSTEPRTVEWMIAKAVYDLSGVTFPSATFDGDGTAKFLAIEGTLPEGVTVVYVNNGQTAAGEYTVTAIFTGDTLNYESIPAMTATLTIVGGPEPPPVPPEPTVVTNHPSPIAFSSIQRVAEGKWELVVTNRVRTCWYRLLSTTDLKTDFTVSRDWTQAEADGPWTTTNETASAATFWKAEAKDGEETIEKE